MSIQQTNKNIVRPMYRKVLFILAIIGIVFVVSYISLEAQYLNASVDSVIARNSICVIGGKSSRREECTEFFLVGTAVTSKTQTIHFIMPIGSKRGYDNPISDAKYHEGGTIPVVLLPGFSKTEQGDQENYFIESNEFIWTVGLIILCLTAIAYLYRPSCWEVDIDKMNREIEEGEKEMENELKKMIEEEEREEKRQKWK